MTAELPALEPGTVLCLVPDAWRYHGAHDGHLVLILDRYREDISQYYDDEVWIEGTRLDGHWQPIGAFQALVRIKALRLVAEAAADSHPHTVAHPPHRSP